MPNCSCCAAGDDCAWESRGYLGEIYRYRDGVGAFPQAALLGNRWRRSHYITTSHRLRTLSADCIHWVLLRVAYRRTVYISAYQLPIQKKAFSDLFSNHHPVPKRTNLFFASAALFLLLNAQHFSNLVSRSRVTGYREGQKAYDWKAVKCYTPRPYRRHISLDTQHKPPRSAFQSLHFSLFH